MSRTTKIELQGDGRIHGKQTHKINIFILKLHYCILKIGRKGIHNRTTFAVPIRVCDLDAFVIFFKMFLRHSNHCPITASFSVLRYSVLSSFKAFYPLPYYDILFFYILCHLFSLISQPAIIFIITTLYSSLYDIMFALLCISSSQKVCIFYVSHL